MAASARAACSIADRAITGGEGTVAVGWAVIQAFRPPPIRFNDGGATIAGTVDDIWLIGSTPLNSRIVSRASGAQTIFRDFLMRSRPCDDEYGMIRGRGLHRSVGGFIASPRRGCDSGVDARGPSSHEGSLGRKAACCQIRTLRSPDVPTTRPAHFPLLDNARCRPCLADQELRGLKEPKPSVSSPASPGSRRTTSPGWAGG